MVRYCVVNGYVFSYYVTRAQITVLPSSLVWGYRFEPRFGSDGYSATSIFIRCAEQYLACVYRKSDHMLVEARAYYGECLWEDVQAA